MEGKEAQLAEERERGAAADFFSDMWALYLRTMRTNLRMPIWIVLNLFQPLLWLVMFSQLFQGIASLPGFPAGNYLQYFAPGVIAMTVLFGSAWSGMSLIYEWRSGVMDKMLATPCSRLALLLGRVLFHVTSAVVQGLIILLIALLSGAQLTGGVFGFLLIVYLVSVLGISFAAISFGLATRLKSEDPMVATLNFILMPLVFMSSAMMPAELAAPWLGYVMPLNPVNWAIAPIRSVMNEGWVATWSSWPYLLALTCFAAVTLFWASRSFVKVVE